MPAPAPDPALLLARVIAGAPLAGRVRLAFWALKSQVPLDEELPRALLLKSELRPGSRRDCRDLCKDRLFLFFISFFVVN